MLDGWKPGTAQPFISNALPATQGPLVQHTERGVLKQACFSEFSLHTGGIRRHGATVAKHFGLEEQLLSFSKVNSGVQREETKKFLGPERWFSDQEC